MGDFMSNQIIIERVTLLNIDDFDSLWQNAIKNAHESLWLNKTDQEMFGVMNKVKNAYRKFIDVPLGPKLFVAKINDEYVGFIDSFERTDIYENGIVQIGTIYVKDSHKGRGIGSLLMKKIIESYDVELFWLEAKNSSKEFFIKNGFKRYSDLKINRIYERDDLYYKNCYCFVKNEF
jgi:ribosomal protein S18 acetylase RimI-like enzyme